ncbi:MAG: selenocysteine-specific translation elongation factor [Anaerolineae bacterium]|nr:selenocysteine-specific translation elongation factor [Anaerolineae bacterium]
MYVVGTAGHVDHGKSTLVRALTGIDPDRLQEEKQRQMTIDLGFAWLPLPDGNTVGIIDVPGHRDFIENMLAGVGAIDAVIFVVAADEGVMPQTREHLAIIDLLGVPTGLIALTKIDLAPDPDWIELLQLDLQEVVSNTVLKDAPIIPVSARQGIGLEHLKTTLASLLATRPPAVDLGKPRLWVDRVFTVSGFGTVVTGTLLDGSLSLGQELQVLPSRRVGRIRGLQSHNQRLDSVQPGTRVAVNLAGLDKTEIHRGDLLTLPDQIVPTQLVDVRFRHLPASQRPLRHNAEVKFFTGSAERIGIARLLEGDTLMPDTEGWLQLELRDDLPLRKGDRFILRYPSPSETIGGGTVIDPRPDRRWRRNRSDVIARLEALARGNPEDVILQTLQGTDKPQTIADLSAATGFETALVARTVEHAVRTERAVRLEAGDEGIVLSANAANSLRDRVIRSLTGFHKAEPLRLGIRSEMLRTQLGLGSAEFNAIMPWLVTIHVIVVHESGHFALPTHEVKPTKAQRAAIDKLSAAFSAAPYSPPSVKDAVDLVGEDVLAALIDNATLRQVSPDVLFSADVYAELVTTVRQLLETDGYVNVRMLRDRFATSRKYALGLLEHLNALGITKRNGDDHVIASGEWEKAH